MDALLLARIQFGFTVSFHIVFPGLTIGLASMALWMLLAVAPLQAIVGDAHGLNTLEYQPAKLAAIEGHWQNHPGEGVPLNHFPRADRPNSTVVFWTFRVMVGLGMLMILLALLGLWLRRGGRLYRSRVFLRFALLMAPSGLIALLAGWMTTEIGRQPWVVYGLMRTADAVSPVGAEQLGISLALFVVVYFVVFGAGTGYLLKLIAKGPRVDEGLTPVAGEPGQHRHPARPLSAADDQAAALIGTLGMVNQRGDAHGH